MEGYPAVGEVVAGRYRIEALLGEGGMGAVFRALEVAGAQRVVALKFASPEMRTRPGMASRFANEAVAASKIASEHVVKILGVEATSDGTPFIVMELLEGRDLDDVIEKEAPLPPDRAVHYALQILRALQVAHGVGVVHRDLKPSNCFIVNQDGAPDHVKLIDFGITKILGDDSQQLTKTSTTLGTPSYMSPEQAKSAKAADARSDLYSVGVILYELLTRKRPFDAGSHNELVVKICTEPPLPLRSHRNDLPSKLVAAVEHALVKSPTGRFQTAEAFARELQPFAGPQSAGVIDRIADNSAAPPSVQVAPAPKPQAAGVARTAVKMQPRDALAATDPSSDAPPKKKNVASTAPMQSPEAGDGPALPAAMVTARNISALAASAPGAMPAPPPITDVPVAGLKSQNPEGREEEKTVVGDVGPLDFGNGPSAVAGGAMAGARANAAAPNPYAAAPVAGYSDPDGDYADSERRSGGSTALIAVLSVLALGLIGSGVYYAFSSTGGSRPTRPTTTQPTTGGGDDDDDNQQAVKDHKTHSPTSTAAGDDTAIATTTHKTAKPPPGKPPPTVHPTTSTTTATPPKPTVSTPPTIPTFTIGFPTITLPPATTTAPPPTTPTIRPPNPPPPTTTPPPPTVTPPPPTNTAPPTPTLIVVPPGGTTTAPNPPATIVPVPNDPKKPKIGGP